MTYDPKSPPRRIDLGDEDRELLRNVAQDVIGRVKSLRSFQTRFGSSALRKLSIVIVQDPDNPDTVQICTDVISDGPPYEISCWCVPPGVCIEGPCPGPLV